MSSYLAPLEIPTGDEVISYYHEEESLLMPSAWLSQDQKVWSWSNVERWMKHK